MQIAILVEQMRREGHEVLVSRPEVIYRKDPKGNLLEPIEKLFLEIPKDTMGVVLENLASRKGEITNRIVTTGLIEPGDLPATRYLKIRRGVK